MFFAQDGTRDAEDFSSKFSAVDTRLQEKQYNVGHSAIVPPQIPVFINIFQVTYNIVPQGGVVVQG